MFKVQGYFHNNIANSDISTITFQNMTLKTKALYYIFTNISSTTLQYNNDNCYTIIFGHCINDLKNNGILVHFSKHFINILLYYFHNSDICNIIIKVILSTTMKTMAFYYFIFQDFSPTASQNPGRSVIRHNSPVRAAAVGFPPDNCFRDRTAERSSRSRSVRTNRKSLRRKRADQSLQVKRQ